MADNILYYGDNLDILQRYIKDESIDLIYLDPPFKSDQNYNVLFEEKNGSRSKAQIKAFEDTWRWDQEASQAYHEIVEKGPQTVSQTMQAFRHALGENDMLAYISMMAPRLVEMRRVLKPSGSIFLHCDTTASHYLKMLMDSVFGAHNFKNDIVWTYQKWGRVLSNTLGYEYQSILFYGKSKKSKIINYPTRPWESKQEYIRVRKQKVHVDKKGREYVLSDAGGGKRVERYINDAMEYGRPVGEVWSDIGALTSSAKERLGYPTQKPEALLERIIKISTKKHDIVLDPFCGCGTTISVAQRLERNWIGIDITHLAIALMKHRLHDSFGKLSKYDVIGEPVSITGAEALAKSDPYQFQWWALGLVGARPVEQKKGADKGIDGRLYFHDEAEGKTKQIIFSVKAGKVSVNHVRDLRGVIEREDAEIGVLISFNQPTKPMMTEAASAGFYHSPGWNKNYPKIQLFTVGDLLDGKTINYPPSKYVDITFKKAPKAKTTDKQKSLFD
jgi:site-specific DNA-methyltransferase (adenine-specific)